MQIEIDNQIRGGNCDCDREKRRQIKKTTRIFVENNDERNSWANEKKWRN